MFIKLKIKDSVTNRDKSFIGEIMSIKGSTAKVSVSYPEELSGIIKECHVSELIKVSPKETTLSDLNITEDDSDEPDTFREQKAVSEFHSAFGYPQASKPTPLTKEEAFKRAVFIMEEVIEFIAASVDDGEDMVKLVNELTQSHAVEAMNKELINIGRREDVYDEVDRLVGQADALVDILYFTHGSADQMAVELLPLFKIVQKANMSKLDPETGKPLYNDFGKIIKGSAFTPPEPMLYEEVLRQIKEAENNEQDE